jgi:hypothetical protein
MSRQRKKDNKNCLTDMQETFLNYWFKNGHNGSEAYQMTKPHVSATTARNEAAVTLAIPCVAAEVARRKMIAKQESEIDFGWVVKKIKTLIYECIEDDDRYNLLRGIDLLNKMAGFYTTKVELNDTTKIKLITDKFEGEETSYDEIKDTNKITFKLKE